MAQPLGFEPRRMVLETIMLPLHQGYIFGVSEGIRTLNAIAPEPQSGVSANFTTLTTNGTRYRVRTYDLLLVRETLFQLS